MTASNDNPDSSPEGSSTRSKMSGRAFDGRWAIRATVLSVLLVSILFAFARPQAPAAAACNVEGRPSWSLADASVDSGLTLTESELSQSEGAKKAFARLPLHSEVSQITVDAVGDVGRVGLIVGGFPSANAPYIVARAIPSFGTIVLFKVTGENVDLISSVFEETPAKGSIFGLKRTDSGIEVYRDCHYAGQFPLDIDPLITEYPRIALELSSGAHVRRIDLR